MLWIIEDARRLTIMIGISGWLSLLVPAHQGCKMAVIVVYALILCKACKFSDKIYYNYR